MVPARVVGRKAEGVEILGYGDNGGNIVVIGECGRGEAGFDELPG